MITIEDLEAMGFQYYSNTGERTKILNMSPLDMVKEYAQVTAQNPTQSLYASLIEEEYEEWKKEYWGDYSEFENELKELADMVYVIYGYANSRGWNLDEAVRRVHTNNVGRCVQPDGSIKRRGDGKILKNKEYPTLDLSDLV